MTIFDVATIIGTVSFALSGFFVGVRKNLDILGIFISMTLTALGGGVVRDLLVGHTPTLLVLWEPMSIVCATFFVAWIFRLSHRDDIEQKGMFVISDSVGLVAFSMTGALLGLELGYTFFGVIALSFITAVGGGIMRDILVNEVPIILTSEFYGSVAIVIATLMYFAHFFGFEPNLSGLLITIMALFLRLLAYFRDWHLPKIGT